jgi:hypothetical protein
VEFGKHDSILDQHIAVVYRRRVEEMLDLWRIVSCLKTRPDTFVLWMLRLLRWLLETSDGSLASLASLASRDP